MWSSGGEKPKSNPTDKNENCRQTEFGTVFCIFLGIGNRHDGLSARYNIHVLVITFTPKKLETRNKYVWGWWDVLVAFLEQPLHFFMYMMKTFTWCSKFSNFFVVVVVYHLKITTYCRSNVLDVYDSRKPFWNVGVKLSHFFMENWIKAGNDF